MTTGANSIKTTPDTTVDYNEYVEGMEQSMAEVKEYAANIKTTTMPDAPVEALKAKIVAQRKQTADILAQNRKMIEAMMKMGAVVGAGPTEPTTKTPQQTNIYPVCNKRATHAKEYFLKHPKNKYKSPSFYK